MFLTTRAAGQDTAAEPADQVQMRGQTCFRWQMLPAEIRLIILELLVPQARDGTCRLSNYASVCLDWQAFFEKITFRSIELSYSPLRIIEFQSYMSGSRLAALQKITFHISLQGYTCDGCDKKEDKATIINNNAKFTEGLASLFSVMSSWTLTTGHGIWLELCAGSLSDTQHYFNNAENDGSHGVLAHQQQSRNFSLPGSKKRLIGSLLDFHTRDGEILLPQVPIISGFSMNRPMFRSLSSSAMQKVLERLGGLRCVRYVPWRSIDDEDQAERDQACGALLANLPPKISKVFIWEAQEIWLHGRKPKPRNVQLGWFALRASFDLQNLVMSHAVEAGDFFRPFYSETKISTMPAGMKQWGRLRRLSLTSQIPRRLTGSTETNELLLAASRAVWRMPCLQIMEIWHGDVGKGFLFRYEVLHNATNLTIESTWPFEPSQKTLQSWELVANDRTRHRLSVTQKILQSSSLRTPESICRRLKLRGLVKNW